MSRKTGLLRINLLDIKVDVLFKDFFGDKNNEEILENFINNVLGLKRDPIIEVEEFLDPRKMRVEVGQPTTFLDLSVKAKSGERYIIEMQTLE
ncbi:MAG: PD-(D/E)XK nuclease family transposase [Simkaniaceae bacterium]|nr:PD-(D/E)XK nuclease family transposase [Simkaniaceae bacterium]